MSKYVLKIVSAILAFLALLFVLTAPTLASSHSEIVISEIMYKPAWSKTDACKTQSWFEWVELKNTSNTLVELSLWKIMDAGYSDNLQGQAKADSYFVIVAKEECFRLNHPGFSGDLVSLNSYIGNGLSDSGDSVILTKENIEQDRKDYLGDEVALAGSSLAWFDTGWKEADPTPGSANGSSVTPSPSPTSTPTPTPAASEATYKINEVKNEGDEILSRVKVYLDGVYLHHYAPEVLTFCQACKCDIYVNCGFGTHTIKLEKTGYESWSDTKTINAGSFYEADPVMSQQSSAQDSAPSSTLTPTEVLGKASSLTSPPTTRGSSGPKLAAEELTLGIQEATEEATPSSEETPEATPGSLLAGFSARQLLAFGLALAGLALLGFSSFSFLKGKPSDKMETHE